MRTDHPEPQPDPLAPLVTALIERAKRDAADMLAEADSDAADVLAGARAEADALLADARAKGESDAADVLATERARAEREARAILLAAQEEAHEHVRRAARDAVSDLRDDPVHPQLLAALRLQILPITPEIALLSRSDLFLHGDPADRLIGATALQLGAPLITADTELRALPDLHSVW